MVQHRRPSLAPPAYTFGNVGRNTVYGPGMQTMDLALTREFTLTEKCEFQIRGESFNALNQPTGDTKPFVNTPQFGTITDADDPRTGSPAERQAEFLTRGSRISSIRVYSRSFAAYIRRLTLHTSLLFALPVVASFTAHAAETNPRHAPATGYREWKVYGGGPESIRYSTLDQINRGNVAEAPKSPGPSTPATPSTDSEMECNPIVVNGVLYATTPKLRVDRAGCRDRQAALDLRSATTAQKVRQSPQPRRHVLGRRARPAHLLRRAAIGCTRSMRAPARVSPASGMTAAWICAQGLGRDPDEMSISATTPGIIYQDLLIMGSIVSEDAAASARRHPRASTSAPEKSAGRFHTIPHPGEFGYETWPKDAWKYIGAANNWAGMSLDEKRGLVFVPTGSAAFDFYGANRRATICSPTRCSR